MILSTIIIFSLMILGAAAALGILITTVVPYFIEGRSLKRQKLYSTLGFCLAASFASTLVNSWLAGNVSVIDSIVILQCDRLMLVVYLLFIFLQDGVTVFVGAAHASRNYTHIHDLLKLTVTGALFYGVVVMIVMISIYFVPPVFALFVPQVDVRREAIGYYIVQCLGLPFYFIRLMSIGFLLGMERLSTWFKMEVAYVIFEAVWYAILVRGGDTGAAGRAGADLMGGAFWVGAVIFVYIREFKDTYPIHLSTIFTIENKGLIKDSMISCANLMTRDFFFMLATTLPYIFATATKFGADDHTSTSSNAFVVDATTTTARAVVVMTLSTLFFQGYAPYLAYIGRWRGSRVLCKPMGGKSREFRRLALSLIVQGTIVGCISVATASLGRKLIPELVLTELLDAPGEIPAVLEKLKYVWWALVVDVTGTNLNGVYQSLVWAAKDFTYVRTITVSSFFFIYLPVLLTGYFYDSLLILWSANCCYTVFQLCCYAWRVHTRILTSPLHGDKNLLITWQLVRNGNTSLGLEPLEEEEGEEEDEENDKDGATDDLQNLTPINNDDSNNDNNNVYYEIELTSPNGRRNSVDSNNAAIIV